jgi:hypothetical protein
METELEGWIEISKSTNPLTKHTTWTNSLVGQEQTEPRFEICANCAAELRSRFYLLVHTNSILRRCRLGPTPAPTTALHMTPRPSSGGDAAASAPLTPPVLRQHMLPHRRGEGGGVGAGGVSYDALGSGAVPADVPRSVYFVRSFVFHFKYGGPPVNKTPPPPETCRRFWTEVY